MKKFLFLLLAVTAGTAPAQTLVYPGEHEMPPVPKTFDNELGVRYGAQLYAAIHLADRTYRLVLAPGEPGAECAE